jgi:hypothetical protein
MKTVLNTGFVVIDGSTYNVGVLSVDREAPVLDKYAERTDDGVLHREVIGTYYNYKIKFGNSVGDPEEYDRLYDALTSPKPYHTIKVPYGRKGHHTYQAYISSVKDSVYKIHDAETYWNNLTASFIAQKPART